jgi:hypothetical protein
VHKENVFNTIYRGPVEWIGDLITTNIFNAIKQLIERLKEL